MQAPVASAYGSGGEDDDDPFEFELELGHARLSASQTKFMRPLTNSALIPAQQRRRRRAAPASPRDRERDRDPDAAMDLPPMPPPGPVPPALYESQMSREVTRALGPGNGIQSCFACRMTRGQLVPPAARAGLEMIATLLRTASAGACYLALAMEIHMTFEKHVREPMNRYRRDDEEQCPTWHQRDIYDHYFTPSHGRIDAVMSQVNRATSIEQMYAACDQYMLYEDVRLADGRPCQVPRPEVATLMIRLSRELSSLYAQRQSSFSLAANDAPAAATAPGVVDTRRSLIGPAPRRHT